MAVASPLKWHGGKSYLAKKIISLMPPRCKNPNKPDPSDSGWLHYCEPFFGGGNVLFAMDPNDEIGEIANDINGELTNFWDVLKSEIEFSEFKQLVELTPCSSVEFKRAISGDYGDDSVSRAVAFFVRNRQSRQALGNSFCTIAKSRTRRGMNELPSAWLSAIEGLPDVHARLQRVVILNQDAIKTIKQQDGPRTLHYLDPTYLHSTRSTTGEYEFEMTINQHETLLKILAKIKGRFILSGYPSELYRDYASQSNWQCVEIKIDNKASGKREKEKKIECLWYNYRSVI